MTYRPVTVSAIVAGDLIGLKLNSFVKDPPGSGQDLSNYLGAHCIRTEKKSQGLPCVLTWSRSTQGSAAVCLLARAAGSLPSAPKVDTNPKEAGAPGVSPCFLQSLRGCKVGKLGCYGFSISPCCAVPHPHPSRVVLYTVYTALFILQNDVTGLIIHVVVKRLSFVVVLFGLQCFKVT